jgi:hypothetical protein
MESRIASSLQSPLTGPPPDALVLSPGAIRRYYYRRCSSENRCQPIAGEQLLPALAICVRMADVMADVMANMNAAINIAAGHAVTARGGFRDAGPVNREPQLLAFLAGRVQPR